MTHTHYDNLRITRKATPGLIKAAYRALCQEFHPDKNPSADATRIMQIINDAYSILGDPVARAKYDAKLAAEDVAGESRRAQAEKQQEQRRSQDKTERERRDSEAARRQREAQEAERKRQSDEASQRRQAAEEAELKWRTEAASEQARRDKAEIKGVGDYIVPVFIMAIVLLGIILAILQSWDVHVKPDATTPVETNANARAEPNVLDRPDLVQWVKSARDNQHRKEMYYADALVRRDNEKVDVWLMRKYDEPFTGGGKSGYTYAIESAQIDCAMHTIANGAGAVYDLSWSKVADFAAGEGLPLRNHPLDVQATAESLCSHANR